MPIVSTARLILSEVSCTISNKQTAKPTLFGRYVLIVYLLGSRLLGVAQCAPKAARGGPPKICLRFGRSEAAQIVWNSIDAYLRLACSAVVLLKREVEDQGEEHCKADGDKRH